MRATSISQSFKEAQKRLLDVRRRVEDFDEADSATAAATDEFQVGPRGPLPTLPLTNFFSLSQLQKDIDELGTTLTALHKAAADDLWKRKIQNAQNEQRMMSATLREVLQRHNLAREEEEEKRMMDRRYDMDSVKLDNEYKINAAATDSVDMVTRYIEMGRR